MIDLERIGWIVASCLITTILGFVIGDLRMRLRREHEAREELKLKEKTESEQLMRGIRYILKGLINKECGKWLKAGWCPVRNKEVLIEQRDIYHDLGGNSFISSLVEDVIQLPTNEVKQ